MSDYGIIVFKYGPFAQHKFSRVSHNFFHFEPTIGNMDANGVNMLLNYGIFGMALDKVDEYKYIFKRKFNLICSTKITLKFLHYSHRNIYFHAISSTREFSVPSYVLKNEGRQSSYYDYKYVGDRGANGQSGVEFFDETTNVLFYSKITENAIGCWLANTTYTQNNHGSISVLGYPADIKIQDPSKGVMWILTNQLPAFLKNKTLSTNEFNYRILFGKTSEIISGN